MMKKKTTALLLASVAVVTAGGITVAAAREQALRAPNGRISVLERPARAGDTLPAALLKLPVAERFANPAAARQVASSGLRTYYLVPGKDHSVCFLYTSGSGSDLVSAGTCGARAAFLSNGIWFTEVLSPDSIEVALVVPDGYERAAMGGRSVRVRNNVAIFPAGTVGEVTFDGGGMSPLTVDLGEQVDS